MLHSLYRTKLLQVVLALSLDSSPVFTCFHEGKMPVQQSRNTCAGRVLKTMLASLHPASGLAQYPHPFQSTALWFTDCRAQRIATRGWRWSENYPLSVPATSFSWTHGAAGSVSMVLPCLVAKHTSHAGVAHKLSGCVPLVPKLPNYTSALPCYSAEPQSYNSKIDTIFS